MDLYKRFSSFLLIQVQSMDLYGHLSGKQEKNLTRSTPQVTKKAHIVPSGMLQHAGGNVFKGFCYLRETPVQHPVK